MGGVFVILVAPVVLVFVAAFAIPLFLLLYAAIALVVSYVMIRLDDVRST